mmetsp:Transcript_32304/g.82062  ORF Transcript_32304/g.82062 Transcript_32304/m.82062 type:complete len:226 (-) Transcript_32304:706-1383(-)
MHPHPTATAHPWHALRIQTPDTQHHAELQYHSHSGHQSYLATQISPYFSVSSLNPRQWGGATLLYCLMYSSSTFEGPSSSTAPPASRLAVRQRDSTSEAMSHWPDWYAVKPSANSSLNSLSMPQVAPRSSFVAHPATYASHRASSSSSAPGTSGSTSGTASSPTSYVNRPMGCVDPLTVTQSIWRTRCRTAGLRHSTNAALSSSETPNCFVAASRRDAMLTLGDK